jgi:hypothetical protein
LTAPSPHQPNLQNCPECETPLTGKYCHECGEKPPDAHDLTLRHFVSHGVHELTHVDSKIFRTLKALILKPGVLTAEYFAGRRQRYVPPLRLFLVIFALNFFLYTRPMVAFYSVHFLITASKTAGQGDALERQIEHAAGKRHTTKEALIEQIDEHWQHDLSFFQLGDVGFFAICLAVVNWRRYFVEHLIFSLHVFSFTLLVGCAAWFYYARYGFHQNAVLVGISMTIYLLYLFRALPRVYGSTGWTAFLKSCFLVAGLVVARSFFITFTLVVAMLQTFQGK